MAIKVTVEHTTEIYSGKEYPVTITTRDGLQSLIENGKEMLYDRIVECDFGPKMGVAITRTIHNDYTLEERAEGRRRIQAVVTQAMIDQGVW